MEKLYKSIISKYRGKWVSISEDYTVVYAHSKSLDALVERIKGTKPKKGLITKIPSQGFTAYVG